MTLRQKSNLRKMSETSVNLVQEWLSAKGEAWQQAVKEASNLLLEGYMNHPSYRRIVPVEVYRLARVLNSKIETFSGMESGAMLLPTNYGFQIRVNADLPARRFRASVAHELAHTLFYTSPLESKPRRLITHQTREEHFCFDVARHLLAPKQHLEFLEIIGETNLETIFRKLNVYLNINRSWAARIMLADYELVTGIAGRWMKNEDNNWRLIKQGAAASPSLSKDDRGKLRKLAQEYLSKRDKDQFENMQFLDIDEQSNDVVFLIVSMSNLKLFI